MGEGARPAGIYEVYDVAHNPVSMYIVPPLPSLSFPLSPAYSNLPLDHRI